MTDKEKLTKAVKLANAMYHAAQYLTTDASRLHKAMDEYHKFIIHEYFNEEPVSIWHDASEEPEEGKDFAFVTYNGIMWARYRIEDIFIGWQKYRIQTKLDKWAYVSDLLKL